QLNLSWSASTDNVGVTGYKIYRNDVQIGTTATLAYSDTGLSPATSYTYKVAAYDAVGNISAQTGGSGTTKPSEQTTTVVGPYIGSPTLTLGTNGTSVIVKWATDVPSNSRVSYGTASGAYPTYSTDTSCQTSGTAYVTSHCIFIGNLIPGNKYYYRIISAIQSSGASRTSDEYTFVVPALPQTTVPVTATSTTVTQTTAPVTQLVTTVATATNSTVTKEAYFSVTLGGRFCIGDKTVAPVMFKVTPSDGGYFTVPGTGEGTGAMFANKTVDIPSGTYNWTATTNSGYVSATAKQGTFTISKLSACVPAVTTGNLTTTTQPAPSTATQEQPDSSGSQENTVEPRVQTFTTYDAAASAMQTKVETEIPVDMPIQEKIQAIQEIRQNFAPAPQAKTVELGTTTISRIESPKAVIAAVNAILKNRHAEAAVIDTDGDGIADYDETRIYGTDSNDPDTNGDGITDGASILSGIDPKKEEMTPVVYEDPKKVSVAAIAPKDVLTVSRAAAKTVPTADGRMQKIESVTFSGKGLANSYVTLYFFSTPVIVTVKTDSSGNWEYTVDKEFENGEHKIYVAMTDSGGKILMKSSPIPFVKTANAVTLGTLKTGAETTGFFSGNMLWISIGSVVLLGILALFVIGIVLGKKTPTDEVIQTIK
ncbi:MAG: fibronectin type III domain-containing protein, partial [Candidatus Paceibacterota bacterium]